MKVATTWTTNTAIGTVDTFDSTAIYDEISNYDGISSGLSAITTKKPNTWLSGVKNSTQWLTNASFGMIDQYDTTGTYDSTGNFDGIISGSTITTKQPTVWSK